MRNAVHPPREVAFAHGHIGARPHFDHDNHGQAQAHPEAMRRGRAVPLKHRRAPNPSRRHLPVGVHH